MSSIVSPIKRMNILTRFVTTQSNNKIKTEVKNLYKDLIYLSREWHTDLKPQIKKQFLKNKHLNHKDPNDLVEIENLIAKGRYICREMVATYQLKKYRTMKRRYYSEDENKNLEELFKDCK